MTDRVQVRRALTQHAPDTRLVGILRIEERADRGGEAEERERVGDAGDRMCALAEERIAPLALRRVDRAGYNSDVAAQLQGVIRRA